MPFNHNAFMTLQERRGFASVEEPERKLARDIREQIGETISRLSLENLAKAERPRPPTTRQIDILYKYAAKTGNNDLEFYTPPN